MTKIKYLFLAPILLLSSCGQTGGSTSISSATTSVSLSVTSETPTSEITSLSTSETQSTSAFSSSSATVQPTSASSSISSSATTSAPISSSSGIGPHAYEDNPLDESDVNKQVYLNSIGDIFSTWKSYRGDGVTIAVIDSGFDINHPEFKWKDGSSKILDSSCYFYHNGGAVNKMVGKSNVTITDGDPHGTFCAGVASGSVTGSGIVGIAPNSNLMLLKVDKKPRSICEAFKYAADNGAKVITISIGSYYDYEGDLANDGSDLATVFDESINYAYNKGVVICSAAGNGGGYKPTEYTFPGACNHVIGCGGLAYDSDNEMWSGSSYNSSSEYQFVDVFAPSENMYGASCSSGKSTYDGLRDGEWKGTSFSSPQVAGAAALYFQKYPTKTNVDFENSLYTNCIKMEDTVHTGYGRIDIGALMNETGTQKVTFSFQSSSWWNESSAQTYYYCFNSKTRKQMSVWPGNKLNGSVEINPSEYDMLILTRRNQSGTEDWNARVVTINLHSFHLKNGYSIAESSPVWYSSNGPVVGKYI